jgi:hypothetical protein
VLTTPDGSKHTFANLIESSCNDVNQPGGPYPLNVPISESANGSMIRLDTTNPQDIVAKLKDGTVLHFAGAPTGGGSFFFTSMIDTNGNQITSTTSSSGTTFTDTLGRQVIIANNGNISYRDSSSIS